MFVDFLALVVLRVTRVLLIAVTVVDRLAFFAGLAFSLPPLRFAMSGVMYLWFGNSRSGKRFLKEDYNKGTDSERTMLMYEFRRMRNKAPALECLVSGIEALRRCLIMIKLCRCLGWRCLVTV